THRTARAIGPRSGVVRAPRSPRTGTGQTMVPCGAHGGPVARPLREALRPAWHCPSSMTFPLNAYLLALLGGFLTSFLTLPLWRRWCLRVGLVDEPGHRKIHAAPVPLAGGLAVLTGLTVPLVGGAIAAKLDLLGINTSGLLSHGLSRRALELIAIVFGALGMVALGCWDDKHELRPAAKFGGQLLIALLVAASGVPITLFVHSTLFSYAITVLWMLTVTNALNFMDNMNGLCAGLGAIGAGWFAVIAAVAGQYLVALIALVGAGALLGFLP